MLSRTGQAFVGTGELESACGARTDTSNLGIPGQGETPESWCLQQGTGQGLGRLWATLVQDKKSVLSFPLPFSSIPDPDSEVCKTPELLGAVVTEITCNPPKLCHFPRWS